jgi:branched-chain amino acid transport system ATP-binding protein
MTSSDPLLRIVACAAGYGGIRAIDDFNIDVGRGEIVSLIGSNGAGKSTLLKTVAGLLTPMTGEVVYDGKAINDLPAHRRARAGIGYSPEGRRVFPGLSVAENLEVASPFSGREIRKSLDDIYGIFPALFGKRSSLGWTLSGGQQQMLAIGRALMNRPRLLLLDEPSLGLSPKLTDEVLNRIPDIAAAGTAALIAEQNMAKALNISHRAYVISNGRVVRHGTAAELKEDTSIKDAYLGG